MHNKNISISLLCDSDANLEKSVYFLAYQNVFLHIDIMNADFSICSGLDYERVFSLCSNFQNIKYDAHIMAKHPEEYVDICIQNRCDFISFHIEGEQDTKKQIEKIHNSGLKAGLAICPNTDIFEISEYLHEVDLINVMTVYPGPAGQKFQKASLSKVLFLVEYREKNNLNYVVEVDGSCNSKHIYDIESAGTDIFVIGASGLFNLSPNIEKAWHIMNEYLSQEGIVYLHADLVGNPLKEYVKEWLASKKMPFIDLYTDGIDEYPECARILCQKVLENRYNNGILCCGTGIGMSIVANKIPNIRAAVVSDPYSAKMAKQHNDCNVLCLGSRVITKEITFTILDAFFSSHFLYGKHTPRVDRYETTPL